jgi:peptidoglycan/xylan/chitin deacetylase (PgdA/CDA1 family)
MGIRVAVALFTLVLVRPAAAQTTSNLLANPSLETAINGHPAYWYSNRYGPNNAAFFYPVPGFQSPTGARVTITQYESGDAKWFPAPVSVAGLTHYRFSDIYVSSGPSSVVLEYGTVGGGRRYQWLRDLGPTSTPQKVDLLFTTPADVTTVIPYHALVGAGSLTIDQVSLERAPGSALFEQAMITLRFDDSWRSIYRNAIPILERAGFPSTQYVITKYANGMDVDYYGKLEWLSLLARGHGVESHTESHPSLPTLFPDPLWDEVAGSRNALLAAGVWPAATIAYPRGEFNDTVIQAVRDAGYAAGLGTREGYIDKDTDRFQLPCENIRSDTPPETVHSWIDQAVADRKWLVLTFHQIRDDGIGTPYSATTALLQDVVDYLRSRQVKVVTVSEGLTKMGVLPNLAPRNIAVSPSPSSSPAGVARTITGVYSDANGAGDLAQATLRVGSTNSNGLYCYCDPINNRLWLLSNSGYVGGFAPGSAHIIFSSQGSLDCSRTTVWRLGNTLTVNWRITPAPSFVGTRSLCLFVRDRANLNGGLVSMGTWTITR